MRSLSDSDLVARTRGGEREAFGYLVERYQDPMFRYVRHMGFGEADARDILQDAFVRAYRHLGRCGDPERFDGWLFKIVANLCRTEGRRAGRRARQRLDQTPLVDEAPGPQRLAEADSVRGRVRHALDALPSDQRQAVVLFYMEGHSVREIAALTGASTSAVKMRLLRAREELRVELDAMRDEA